MISRHPVRVATLAGIMRREGPFQDNLATNEFFYEQRITGGTGDFEDSRGHQTAPGAGVPGVPCVGSSGTYKGVPPVTVERADRPSSLLMAVQTQELST